MPLSEFTSVSRIYTQQNPEKLPASPTFLDRDRGEENTAVGKFPFPWLGSK